jgi:hypothetical protein
MAKRQGGATSGGGESVAGYFRNIFKQQPKLLGERSNDKLLQQWLKDHPDQTEVPNNVKTSLSNIKSVLRSKKRGRVAKRAEENQVVEHGMQASIARVPTGSSKLELLEQHIDECLIEARMLDKVGLEDVIHYLRRARNAVVWKIGQ